MVVLSLFDGLSSGMLALNRIGVTPSCYIASEIDPYAIKVSERNFPDIMRVGDILNWRDWGLDWANIDLILAGSPCQGFSLQGGQLGFDDPRSVLYFVFLEILTHVQELNPDVEFLLENVRMKQEFLDVITNGVGVVPLQVNSSRVVCQSRLRYYWSSLDIVPPEDLWLTTLASVTMEDPEWRPATTRKGDPRLVKFTGHTFGCLTASYYKGIRADGRPALSRREGPFDELRETGDVKILTPEQCERLQTIPSGYTEGVSYTQRYKMLGNAWTVDVISHFLEKLF